MTQMAQMNGVSVWAFRRSNAAPSVHSLQVLGSLVPQPPVGFPLLSLTRNAVTP
jgi:hypothetical protein